MSSGELSFEFPPSLRVTWTIPDFFRLTMEPLSSLRSPDFTFADGCHYLRLFQDWDCSRILIELLNSNGPDPGRAVSYEVQLKSPSEEIRICRCPFDNKQFYVYQSDLEHRRDACVPGGTLIVLCSVRSRELGNAMQTLLNQVHPPCRMTGTLTSESFPCMCVKWRIPAFFQWARRRDLVSPEFPFSRIPTFYQRPWRRDLLSPEFPFSGDRYRLQLFLDQFGVEVHLKPANPRNLWYGILLKSTTGEEIEIKSSDPSTKRRLSIDQCDLDAIQPVRFSDGHLTVLCVMRSGEPSSARSARYDGAETWDEEDDKVALTGVRPSSEMSSGELSFEFPPSLRVTWTIPDFFRLAMEPLSSLRSPDFNFADGCHYLRLFQGRDCSRILIELLNSNDSDTEKAVSYEVQLKSTSEEIRICRCPFDNKQFCVYQSGLERRRDACVPGGTLIVLCSVRSRELGTAMETPLNHVHPPCRMTGNLTSGSFPCLCIKWWIPAFFQRTGRCELVSPEFPFSGHRYQLQLFLDQFGVKIHLVNLTDPVSGRYVWYEVGLKSTSGEEIEIKSSGASTKRRLSIHRRDLDAMQPMRFPDNHLTVFCCMRSREPSCDRSPRSGGAETSNEDDNRGHSGPKI